jgi:hypothetical protein
MLALAALCRGVRVPSSGKPLSECALQLLLAHCSTHARLATPRRARRRATLLTARLQLAAARVVPTLRVSHHRITTTAPSTCRLPCVFGGPETAGIVPNTLILLFVSVLSLYVPGLLLGAQVSTAKSRLRLRIATTLRVLLRVCVARCVDNVVRASLACITAH